MKNKISSVLSIITCILMVFAIIGTFAALTADRVYTPEFLLSQAEKTNTYENAYNSLMKRFQDNYSISGIPSEVYEKSFTPEWMKEAVKEKIRSSYENYEAVIDCTAAEENITEYFENYAREEHVIKDEIYENKLAESVSYAQKTALNAADIYSLDVMKRAGITDKLSSGMTVVRKCIPACIAALIVLFIALIFLGSPAYWTGTALFSSGLLLLIPSAVVRAENLIQKFSLKDYTTYTLVTGTLGSLNNFVFTAGCILVGTGAVLIALHCIILRIKENRETKEN